MERLKRGLIETFSLASNLSKTSYNLENKGSIWSNELTGSMMAESPFQISCLVSLEDYRTFDTQSQYKKRRQNGRTRTTII